MNRQSLDRRPLLHRHLVFALLEALYDVFGGGYYADKVAERYMKTHPKWGARDRHFFAESLYEIVRWWRLLLRFADLEHFNPETAGPLDYSRIFAAYWCGLKQQELPQWTEFQGLQSARYLSLAKQSLHWPRAVRQSIPDWLDQIGAEELGEAWDEVLITLNDPAEVILRVNRLKTDMASVIASLSEDEIQVETIDGFSDALRLEKRANVFRTKAFKAGLFEVQDASSQRIAPLMDPKPGERIIDACAGAGGKTLHLAAMMKNKGKILALDIHERKLTELKRRAARAGVDIVETHVIDSTKTIKRLKASADGVLLDVPCSGLGVLRRNPDTKWKLKPENLDELVKIQRQILEDYSSMVKPLGRLVYATCSLLPRENEKQIAWFRETHSEWKLEEEIKILPTEGGFDGFYAARLSRR